LKKKNILQAYLSYAKKELIQGFIKKGKFIRGEKISCIHVPRNTFYFIYKVSTMMLETANENECPSLRQIDSPSECMKTDRI